MIYVVYYNKTLRREFGVLKKAKIFAEKQGANKIFAYSDQRWNDLNLCGSHTTGVPMYVLVHEDWLVDGGTWAIEGTLT